MLPLPQSASILLPLSAFLTRRWPLPVHLQMRDAIEHQKKARKCWCCFIIILIILIVVAISGVSAVFAVKKS